MRGNEREREWRVVHILIMHRTMTPTVGMFPHPHQVRGTRTETETVVKTFEEVMEAERVRMVEGEVERVVEGEGEGLDHMRG